MKLEQTAMNFLLKHQESHRRTYNFLILMESIMTAAKYIQYYYQIGALSGNLGKAGVTNVQGEEVMRMDEIANHIVMKYLRQSGQVIQAVSEEEVDAINIEEEESGRYFVYYDPLDGSSNVKHGLPVGFMFAIAKKNLEGAEDFHLRKGREYIAAGMFVIPSGIFTLALRNAGTYRFYMDETMTYVRPEKVTIPGNQKSWELSFNASNRNFFDDAVRGWIEGNEPKYAFRYIGALAGDFHRLLSNGGMFMYPAIVNHPKPEKNRPEGKLRLMYEAAVTAFIAEEAGGAAINEQGENILDIIPQHRHQRTSLYVGSKPLVEEIRTALKKTTK
ncbi:MAG: class 1 fructose-bisphosphatase [Myxococcota bacterium]